MPKILMKKSEAPAPAEVLLHGVIGWDFSSSDFAHAVASAGEGDLVVRINSLGGDFADGVAMYNALVRREGRVTAEVEGMAASAASIVAMGADHIVMREGATMFVHNPWTFAMGDAAGMAKVSGDLAKLEEEAAGIYARRTGRSLEDVREIMSADTLYTGEEAKEAGFADEVLKKESAPVAALARAMLSNEGLQRMVSPKVKVALMSKAQAEAPTPAPPPEIPAVLEVAETPTPAEQEIPAEEEAPAAPVAEAASEPEPTPAPTPEEPKLSAGYVQEVLALCLRAGKPEMAATLMKDGKELPLDTIRARLFDALASDSASTSVQNHQPLKPTSADPFGWEARLRAAGAYCN